MVTGAELEYAGGAGGKKDNEAETINIIEHETYFKYKYM